MSIQQNYPAIKSSLNLDFANTKQLDPRITYSRASTGTYYDGKTVAKAEENLVTFSEQFDNASWTVGGSTVTANASTAPDGTTTADKLVSSSTTGEQRIYRGAGVSTIVGQVYTYSVYAKSDTVPFVIFRDDFGGYGDTSFNISSGTVGTVASGRTATITSAGNGWYRCSVTATSSLATQQLMFCLASADNGRTSFTGNGTSGVLLWGAQLEQRSFATAYTPTTTAPITNYIPVLQTASAGTPRFDHNPITGESLGLLIEEQRTNLLLRSEEFNNAAWANSNATVTANTIVSPDGTLDADKVIASSGSAQHYILQNVSIAATGVYTASFYAKSAEYTSFDLWLLNAATADRAVASFNLSTGTTTNGTAGGAAFTGQSSTITPVGNGWYRCTLTATTTGGAINLQSRLFPSSSATYSGDGFSGIYIWGAQLETGAFATSYIPTVASQVTRAADSASMTGTNFSSWYNQSEGSVYADIAKIGSNTFAFDFSDNTTNNRTYHRLLAQQQTIVAISNGANQCQIYDGTAFNTFAAKVTFGYKLNDFVTRANGGASATTEAVDAFGAIPVVDRVHIGCTFAATGQINGTIKKIAYYPRRLTNTQLQALTS